MLQSQVLYWTLKFSFSFVSSDIAVFFWVSDFSTAFKKRETVIIEFKKVMSVIPII